MLFGGAGGLTGSGSQMIHQGTAGVPGEHQSSDRFGQALVAASRRDPSDDTIWYLAVGVPGDGDHSGGSVMLFKRTSTGLSTNDVEQIDLFDFADDWAGRPPLPDPGNPHRLANHLALADLNRDNQPDLIIPITGNRNTPPQLTVPGMVCIAFADANDPGTGLTGGRKRCFDGTQFGAAAASDEDFGVAVAADDLDDQPGRDLVIASPGARQVFVLRNPLFGDGFEGTD